MLYQLVAKVIIFFSVYTLSDLIRQFLVRAREKRNKDN